MSAPSEENEERDRLMEKAGMALLRLDLNLVPPAARRDAMSYLGQAGDEFDGRELLGYCLEGRAGDGEQALRRAFLGIRSRLVGEMWSERGPIRRSRARNLATRVSARLLAQFLFFLVQTAVILALLVIVQRRWPEMDVYQLASQAWEQLTGLFR